MHKNYELDSGYTLCGRTLWNNLVIGNMTSTLEKDNNDFIRITSKNDVINEGVCEFIYRSYTTARIKVIVPNHVEIEAEREQNLRFAESALKKVCEDKGCPLSDLD